MTYLGTPVRPRLGIDFAPSPHGAKGRDRRPHSCAASTTGDAEGRVQAAHLLTNKKHPRRVGPGA